MMELSPPLQAAYTDLKAAQVKTISFFTFLLRVTPSLLQPHKVRSLALQPGVLVPCFLDLACCSCTRVRAWTVNPKPLDWAAAAASGESCSRLSIPASGS